MTIGLICALPQEHAHLLTAMTAVATSEIAGVEFSLGELDGHRVVLSHAGMGKVNAALVATLLADRFGCRALAFSGVAGGLDPGSIRPATSRFSIPPPSSAIPPILICSRGSAAISMA